MATTNAVGAGSTAGGGGGRGKMSIPITPLGFHQQTVNVDDTTVNDDVDTSIGGPVNKRKRKSTLQNDNENNQEKNTLKPLSVN